VLKLENLTAIVEIKYSSQKSNETLLDEAMEQIRDRKYYEAYLNKPVILLAIAFTTQGNKDRLTDIACRFEKI
jgi:hypothetical protein